MPPPTATLGTKIKVQLKLALTRLRMLQSRDASLTKSSHRSVAQLIEAHKLDSAAIRVESIIRADILTELHEILELYCELLLARFPLLDSAPQVPASSGGGGGGKTVAVCDPGLEEAVKSIIYAAPRTEIKELGVLRVLLGEKFGKDFVAKAAEGLSGGVSEKVVRRLAVESPKQELVDGYLQEIARAYGIEWARGTADEEQPAGAELDLLVDMADEGGAEGGESDGGALKELESLSGASSSPSAPVTSPPRSSAASPPGQPSTYVQGSSPGDAQRLRQRPEPKAAESKSLAKEVKADAPPPPSSGISTLSELEKRFAALKKIG
ncbi:related to IST1 Putative translation initiation factor, has a role in resistance to high concentrations of sodium [Cephalotrichum gorgonifer]|uniref:Related to IST1 Putative translation initiation factor, has a role in resistance to high concentrations of sodium n=1 Tax=Cephalotrichum gorgonifer TaxID=2041049 RepID=A0AAE8STC1_9PEZI|nr:related to IST1 Putative translation initiation factor, has a role in resistance to high concentrations of sodium [Cephalotrichum gorgonifer]